MCIQLQGIFTMKKFVYLTLMLATITRIASASTGEGDNTQERRATCPAGTLKVNVNDDSPQAPRTDACVPGTLPDCGGVVAGKCATPGHVCINSTTDAAQPANHSCLAACGGATQGVCKKGRTCINTAASGQPAIYKCERQQTVAAPDGNTGGNTGGNTPS